MSSVEHVRQEDPGGCGLACVAMVTGRSYAEVRRIWVMNGGDESKLASAQEGLTNRDISDMLYLCDPLLPGARSTDRVEVIPFWNPIIRSVRRGARQSHWVVVDGDGTVLDPAQEK